MEDGCDFTGVESILQTVPEEDDDWKALLEAVWAGGWVCGELTSCFGEHPMAWGCESLKVLALATRHEKGRTKPPWPIKINGCLDLVLSIKAMIKKSFVSMTIWHIFGLFPSFSIFFRLSYN